MNQAYTFQDMNQLSKQGVQVMMKYLGGLEQTVLVIDVQDDPEYQEKDIDLLWVGIEEKHCTLEVKTDRYTTGNFFLETISNDQKRTTGCFLKSEADYFCYYFINKDEMYAMPLTTTRTWFLANQDLFSEKKTSTKDEQGRILYNTLGRIVPITSVMQAKLGVKQIPQISSA